VVKKLKFLKLVILLKFIILTSCVTKKDFTNSDLEEIYYYKSQSILLNKFSSTKIKEFISYDYSSQGSRSKSMNKCINYIKSEKLENVDCKIKFVKFTNKIESSIE